MGIFDPIFGSEDRRWGGVLRLSGSKNEDGAGSSIFGVDGRRSKMGLYTMFRLRRSKMGGSFDLRAPNIVKPPTFDFRPRKSTNPPFSIFASSAPKNGRPKNGSRIGQKDEREGCDFFEDRGLSQDGWVFRSSGSEQRRKTLRLRSSRPEERRTPIFHLLDPKIEEPHLLLLPTPLFPDMSCIKIFYINK